MSKRILIVADRLGCPSELIGVADTWTDRILSKWSSNSNIFYTHCKCNLTLRDIELGYVSEIAPALIIMSVGIEDVYRGSLSTGKWQFIQYIPIVGKFVNLVRNKYLMFVFRKIMRKIKKGTDAKIVFLAVPMPRRGINNKVCNIQGDIENYNSVAKNIPDIIFLNPYKEDSEVISEHNYLTLYGEDIVFSAIDNFLEQYLQDK